MVFGSAWLVACAPEQSGTPSLLGRSWEIQIGGLEDTPPATSRVEFVSVKEADVLYDPRYQNPSVVEVGVPNIPPPTPMLLVHGETVFSLPSPPLTLEAAQQAGVKLVAMTYCGFINAAGEPRDEDVAAVDAAMEAFVSAVAAPMRNAPLTEDGLSAAGKQAADSLMESVLEELRRRGVQDPEADSALVRVLDIYTSAGPHSFSIELEGLADFLPSLVWTFGDPSTRATLSGCGALMLFDVPERLRHQELPTNFPGIHCVGNNSRQTSLACSWEAFLEKRTEDRTQSEIRIQEPLESRNFASWGLVPEVTLSPL